MLEKDGENNRARYLTGAKKVLTWGPDPVFTTMEDGWIVQRRSDMS